MGNIASESLQFIRKHKTQILLVVLTFFLMTVFIVLQDINFPSRISDSDLEKVAIVENLQ